ncbi:MAG: sigma-54 factor interaction domain-containing protein [Planctomycetes bacterium]|nr:sigma-54 factor interaction domain-containing protein [Planctomycetota bacterium]
MPLFAAKDREFAEAIALLSTANPFLPERIEAERRALGGAFRAEDAAWNIHAGRERSSPNIDRILALVVPFIERTRERIAAGEGTTRDELALYEDAVGFHLYHGYRDALHELPSSPGRGKVAIFRKFAAEFDRFLRVPGVAFPSALSAGQAFALCFNLRRAFAQIFDYLVGTSPAAVRLRAAVWQSIFTHDLRRYRRTLFERMGDITTLVCGPSGTGKELVARAIAFARYLPFDEESGAFREEDGATFHPVNLSALSASLIESEVFGHRRGAFTGATDDHAGWFEVCGSYGTVFLDEIGELDIAIQVKLLRVLQDRTFQRLGDTGTRRFAGKVIAATNRDLTREMAAGRFRADLYYRLCSDLIVTPTLKEQLTGSEQELYSLILHIAKRDFGEEAETLAKEVQDVIDHTLGRDYDWPGNFRELEQCVRNVLVRRAYHPAGGAPNGIRAELVRGFLDGSTTAEEMLQRYCTIVYAKTRNFEETARRLHIDRRTVKSKVDQDLLSRLETES